MYFISVEDLRKNQKLAERHGYKPRGRKNFVALYDPEMRNHFSHWRVIKVEWDGLHLERRGALGRWKNIVREVA
jgi:hypothetical protein